MNLADALTMSAESLAKHKLRTGLTMLGVIIGIGSVVALVTLGASIESSVIGQLDADERAGMDVSLGRAQTGDGGPGGREGPPGSFGPAPEVRAISERDITHLRAMDAIATVSPSVKLDLSRASVNGIGVLAQDLVATDPQHPDVKGAIREGRLFAKGATEIVLGGKVVAFDGTPIPLGALLRLELADGRAIHATVIGILDEPTGFSPGTTTAYTIFAPVEPFYTGTPTENGAPARTYSELFIRATSEDNVATVKASVIAYLTSPESDTVRGLPDGYEPRVITQLETGAAISNVLSSLTTFIAAVAVVSLLVGAIGIANIMLVAVTERTKEIGIMKAIGARSRDILALFLVESILIGFVGGIIGLGLGAGAAYALVALLFNGDIAVQFPLDWAATAVGTGLAVGLIAGYLPARRATRIDPIEALAYE